MEKSELIPIWSEVKRELRELLPDHVFYSWIEGLKPNSFEDNLFVLNTVHAIAPQIIKQNHNDTIIKAFKKVLNRDIKYSILYDDDLARQYQKDMKKEAAKSRLYVSNEEEQSARVMKNLTHMQSVANLDLKYKFENFVVGNNNKRAYGCAKMVSENPAEKFNPLFIYGAPGLGKTHIMQAIGHYIIFNRSDLKVRYVKTVDFVNEFMSKFSPAADGRFKNVTPEISKFRQKYRNFDILLIDDIQFIEGKGKTIDEVFHIFDYLLNKNKQIVITSDRAPKEISLPERLTSRFIKGVVVEITPPELEVRIQILKNLAEVKGTFVEQDVIEYIAQNFRANVRELEGAFNNIVTFAEIEGEKITLEYAKNVLKCELEKKALSYDVIAQKTAEFFSLKIDELKSSARAQKISKARQIAVYLCREMTGGSWESIAKFFNKKHTTMIYARDNIADDIINDKELENTVNSIKNLIEEN